MIDLIKKMKRPDTHVSFDEGYNKAIDDVIQLFNQHNIIIAPKTIKLSEIVERLKNEQSDYDFRYEDSSISVWENKWCYAVLYIDEDTHNFEFDSQDRYLFPKWLYALWVAGTEIIDDLEEEE